MDIIGGLVGSLITLILTPPLGLTIWLSDPGPIFFKQTRIGENGKKFQMYKFRSMYMDAEARKKEIVQESGQEDQLMFKLEHDPRIIGQKELPDGSWKKGVGGWIRDLSLDEFPQFFNVLKGDMSLVGTRPPTVDEWHRYEPFHRARMSTKPGITGLWQVSGRSKIRDFDTVVRLDREYIENWSLRQDFHILFKTVWVVLTRKGAM
jgi:lipopolysaccharide/colanic/teichoic acid biosynthesis glycosyltransferase